MDDNSSTFAFDAYNSATPDAEGFIRLPLVIIQHEVIFPQTIAPVAVDDNELPNELAVAHVSTQRSTVIQCNITQSYNAAKPLLGQFEAIGTEVALVGFEENFDEVILMMAQGRRRVEVVAIEQEKPFFIAKARVLDTVVDDEATIESQRGEALYYFGEIAERTEAIPEEIEDYVFTIEDDTVLCDTIASMMPLEPKMRQKLLNELNLVQRFALLLDLLETEISALDVQEDVHTQVQDEISRVQREMYLREQMRVIQQELGEGDVFERDVVDLRERVEQAQLPAEVYKQATKELSRLNVMSPLSPEASVVRTYVEWILDLPWHQAGKDNLNLRHAEKVLNREHYGLEKVKDRILEHIAVRKMAGSEMKTPIICFVGPPGVGKTSLGKSIAEALGREFVRVSLGGVRDEAEIRGHRRTYIGALPGRVIQTIKRAGTINPVFMLDEIDKMSEDYRGDPSAALLEVLDPEQNHAFTDHYLEVPYDLSKVLFIATANELYPLPEALEDRMEIIEFNAYTEEEKLEIAKRFLIPKQLKAHGLSRRGIKFLDSAILHIIRHYTLEAGVRNLERELANVCRKITRLAAMRKKYPKRITSNLVEKYLGPPYLIDSRLNREESIGVTTGLVWTSSGGDTQIIEAALLPGKGNLTLTGSLGDVLQESAQIALNYMRSRADDLDVPHDDFDSYDVHIHLPEGAVPKDGPSAGITLATAIISVFTECTIRNDVAMTGELTLRGHVLSIGGVKEKVLAARRRGIKTVILPEDNRKDLVDLPKNALRDMKIVFVTQMQEVMDMMLGKPPEERQRDLDRDDDEDDEDDE